MGKNKSWIILFCFICWWNSSTCQPLLRQELVNIATSQVGVRELTGNNDGEQIQAYLAITGLKGNYPYCSAFVAWCFVQAEIKAPRSAYSPDMFKTNVVYKRTVKTIKPYEFKKGQVFGLYFESKKRVAHVGFLISETKINYVTIEGNTNEQGAREGSGVFKKIRNKRTIYVISDYIKD